MKVKLTWKVKKPVVNMGKGIPCFSSCKVQKNG